MYSSFCLNIGHYVTNSEYGLHGHTLTLEIGSTSSDVNIASEIVNRLDHKFLVSNTDPLSSYLSEIDSMVVYLPFNPTIKNILKYIVRELKISHDTDGSTLKWAYLTLRVSAGESIIESWEKED